MEINPARFPARMRIPITAFKAAPNKTGTAEKSVLDSEENTNAFLTAAATVLKGQKREFHKLVQEELNRNFGLKVTCKEVLKKMDDMEKLSDGGWNFIMDPTDKASVGDDWEKVGHDGEDKDKNKDDYPVTLVRKEETK